MNTGDRNRAERRLAAILAADVAGYSRLMGRTRKARSTRLKALRAELIDPRIAAHRGRIVKTTGDGLLVEFASVVDALRCASEWQRGDGRADRRRPAAERIEFRIGINRRRHHHRGRRHLRRRRQRRRPPRSAGRARRDLRLGPRSRTHAAASSISPFEDLGEQELKNIARPVRVFRVIPARPALGPPRMRGREGVRC